MNNDRKSPPRQAAEIIDLSGVVQQVLVAVNNHRRGDGFARFSDTDEATLYGTADGIGILATLGRLDTDLANRSQTTQILHSLQRVDGRFVDDSHGTLHSTATAVGALHLVGQPASPPAFLHNLFEPSQLVGFLSELDWANPWLASHDAAGLLAIATMTGYDRPEWYLTYFAWLEQHADPSTGLWPLGGIGKIDEWPGLFGNLGCAFHFHFLFEHHGRPIPYAREVVDSCLAIAAGTSAVFGAEEWGYPQLDWAYSLARASRQSNHRRSESRQVLHALARDLESDFSAVPRCPTKPRREDLHTWAAVAALVAELSAALGDLVSTSATDTPITDLRPFI